MRAPLLIWNSLNIAHKVDLLTSGHGEHVVGRKSQTSIAASYSGHPHFFKHIFCYI